MKQYIVVVFALCIISAFAEDSNSYYGSVREVVNLYRECSTAEGLSVCLKTKALSMVDRLSRMEKISLMDGVVLTGKLQENPNEPALEDEENNLPRSLDAKGQALTTMMINRIARMIGSKSIEISVPKLIQSARLGDDDDDKLGHIHELLDKIHEKKQNKKKDKKHGGDMKEFLMKVMAHKIAMIPLFIGGLFILAVKAFTQAKIALLIAGIIFAKKLLASKNQGGGGGGHVEHVQAGWSGGGGGLGGWSGGAGGGGGWDRRSFDEAQNLAYAGQKQS